MYPALLDGMLTVYGYLPPFPGKGRLIDRLDAASFPKQVRRRRRYGVLFDCDLSDKVTREIYYTGFDRKDCRVLRALIKPTMTVLDVGANIGYFSLLGARWLKGSGTVHAFEPAPETAERFRRNLALNPSLSKTVRLHRLALSDFEGGVDIKVADASNRGCNYVQKADGFGSIRATTLDSWVAANQISSIHLIKVDVEGSEIAVVDGGEKTIRRFRPPMMIEVNPATLQRFGHTAAELIGRINDLNYSMHVADRWALRALSHPLQFGEEPNVFCFPR